MAEKQRSFDGVLLKHIDLDEAKARGIGAALGALPDQNDVLAHVKEELSARWTAFDAFFGVSSGPADIWQQRARAIIERQFGIPSDDPQWWKLLAFHMACRHVPGFSIKQANKKNRGAPLEWNDEQLSQLFADIEFLKKKTGMSVRDICKGLSRRRAYTKRWGRYKSDTLRKQYAKANRYRRTVLFQFVLCGPEATIPANRIDHIEAAIERHALKI